MKVNGVRAAAAAAFIFGFYAISIIGNLSTAEGLLSWFSPSAQRILVSEKTWLILAALSFASLAWELSKDAGSGNKALEDAKNAKKQIQQFTDDFEKTVIELRSERQALSALSNSIKTDHQKLHAQLQEALQTFDRVTKSLAQQIQEYQHMLPQRIEVHVNRFDVEIGTLRAQFKDKSARIISSIDDIQKQLNRPQNAYKGPE